MEKIQLSCYGKQILVDSDQVNFHIKKDSIVKRLMELNSQINTDNSAEMNKLSRSIISLNRKIRKNVQFVR